MGFWEMNVCSPPAQMVLSSNPPHRWKESQQLGESAATKGEEGVAHLTERGLEGRLPRSDSRPCSCKGGHHKHYAAFKNT